MWKRAGPAYAELVSTMIRIELHIRVMRMKGKKTFGSRKLYAVPLS